MVIQDTLDFMANVVEDIRAGKKWVCFGAGQTFRGFIDRNCIQTSRLPLPAYVCDNNSGIWGTEIYGVAVCEPQRLLGEEYDKTIIITTTVMPLSCMEDLIFKLERYYFSILSARQIDSYLYFIHHKEEILQVHRLLEDQRSKDLYASHWQQSILGNVNYSSLYSANAYWGNDLFPHLETGWEVLYAGAFDGKHIDCALKYNEGIVFHGFEPNRHMYELLLEKYKDRKQVKLYPYALGKRNETLRMDVGTPLAANVVRGDIRPGAQIEEVLGRTIDETIAGRLDYIALDIEGYELDALEGARKTIQQYRPMLGICVYHKISDYVDIPLKIKQLNPEYNFFFRHHSPVPFESVIYAIDKRRAITGGNLR